jgi:hypothetical protein
MDLLLTYVRLEFLLVVLMKTPLNSHRMCIDPHADDLSIVSFVITLLEQAHCLFRTLIMRNGLK